MATQASQQGARMEKEAKDNAFLHKKWQEYANNIAKLKVSLCHVLKNNKSV
jgi:hypothetical protein